MAEVDPSVATDADQEQPEPPGSPGCLRSYGKYIFLAVIVLLLVILRVVIGLAMPGVWVGVLTELLRFVFFVLASFFPLIIYDFFQNRRHIILDEYKQNLRRLGFPAEAAIYQHKFDAIYGPDARSSRKSIPFQSPVMVATILTVIGWLIVLYPSPLAAASLKPNPDPMAYGFLGAYVFSLGALLRQYVTDDLQPRYYASITYRYLVAFILSWMIKMLLPEQTAATTSTDYLLLVAFVIGVFPTFGLRLAVRVGTGILGKRMDLFREDYPLHKLDGLNVYHEDRLLLEGIENIQNLVCADIVDLMLRTRLPVEGIVDWMDQALLYLHARERTPAFQKSSLRTATDFLDSYIVQNLPPTDLAQKRQELADLLNANSEDNPPDTLVRMETMASSLNLDPNMFHIRHWRDHQYEALPADLERHRVVADLKLMEGLPDEAIATYNNVLRNFPAQPSILLYRGLAFYAMAKQRNADQLFRQAEQDYMQAIDKGGDKWENAPTAYVQLGRALQSLGEYERAVETYQDAIQKHEPFPEARYELAYLLISDRLRQYEEAIQHLDVVVEAKFKEAEALTNRGLARYELWKQQDRPADTRDQELGLAQSDLNLAIRLKPRLNSDLVAAYLTLAYVLEELRREDEVLSTLTGVLTRLETIPDPDNAYRARLRRGNLYLKREEYQLAAEDYAAAAELAPGDAAAYFNLGVARQNLQQPEAAYQAFQDAVRNNPSHAPANQALGDTARDRGLTTEAEQAYSAALRITRERQDLRGQAAAHLGLGQLYRIGSDQALDAERELAQAMALAEQASADSIYTQAAYELGLLKLAREDLGAAVSLLSSSVVVFDVLGHKRDSVVARLQLGQAYLAQEDYASATSALQKAKQHLAEIFDPENPDDDLLQLEIEAQLARCEAGPE